MTADLTRRNFLRGMVAAAVGLPAIEAIASVAPPPDLPFPDHENGDMFIKVNGVWRFACKVQTFEICILGDDLRTYRPSLRDPGEFRMTSYFDKTGFDLLSTSYYDGLVHEVALSSHGMLLVMKVFFAAMSITTDFNELIRMDIAARLHEPMQMVDGPISVMWGNPPPLSQKV